MSTFDFDKLIAPFSRQAFFSEYWEAKPLRISREQPEYYDKLFSGENIDYALSVACLLDRDGVELLGANETRTGSTKRPAAALYQAYRQGASIRIRGINRYWKPLWNFCIRLQELFGFQAAANLYCTPPNSHALERHYDLHDTMILQVAGRKHWRVFDSPIELPLEYVPLLRFEMFSDSVQYRGAPQVHEVVSQNETSPPVDEFILEPGDFLYLPRGVMHQASASEDLSAHVTIGIYPVTWIDLLTVILGQVGHKEVSFRKAIPIGFNNRCGSEFARQFEELTALVQKADLAKAVEELNASLSWNRQAVGEGSITHRESNEIDIESTIERRPGLMCRFVIDGEVVRLSAAHGDVSLPRFFEPAVRFIYENESFAVKAIPGRLSDSSKINLARRLIDEGFFRRQKNES